MPKSQQSVRKGGKCLTTSESRKARYAHYGSLHGLAVKGHRFTQSKEKRGCGPLGRYNRRKQIELVALENQKRGAHPCLWDLPYSDKTLRILADIKRSKDDYRS